MAKRYPPDPADRPPARREPVGEAASARPYTCRVLDFLKAVVLGLIQGLTEFLPISSSAHLRIFPELFGWGDPAPRSPR